MKEALPERGEVVTRVEHAEREIDDAGLELGLDRVEAQRPHQEIDPRRDGRDPREQRRQDHQLSMIDRGDREAARRGCRVEGRAAAERAIDVVERRVDCRRELLGAGSGHHAAWGAHEDRIAEQGAEAVERVAHRRLREPDPLGRARDVALGEERVERHEEVEIDLAIPRRRDRGGGDARGHARLVPTPPGRRNPSFRAMDAGLPQPGTSRGS